MSFGALFYLELILLLNTLLRNFPSLFLLSGTKKAAIAIFQKSLFYRNTALRTKCHYGKSTRLPTHNERYVKLVHS